jgi:hypothetical protein
MRDTTRFGYRQAIHGTTIPVAPGTVPRLNGMPEHRPYVYRGTGKDELTAFMDEAALAVHLPRTAIRICGPCWDETCDAYPACLGEPCACTCRDGRAA